MPGLTFEVLAEPNRRRILDLLRVAERPVGDLVEALALSQPAVSKHLRVLREAGLVQVRVDAQRRLYRVRPAPLRDVDEWLAPYRVMWASRLDGLARHLDAMPDDDRHEERAMFGTLHEADGRWQLRFTRRFPHPPQKVWRALTEAEHLSAWFPTEIHGERAAGASLRFVFRDGEGPSFDGEMLVFDPPSVLELRWGTDTLRFELRPDGTGTILTLIDSFDELGKAARDAAGWHVCLDRLGYHLAGEDPPWTIGDRVDEVHPAYVQDLGPEAATIGPPDASARPA